MKRFRQPEAFALVQQHYEPLVFANHGVRDVAR